jgi:DNA excision repair protein ERCC-5
VPLFDPDPDTDDDFSAPPKNMESDDDVELAVAIQESLDQEANSSRTTIPQTPSTGPSHMLSFASSSKSTLPGTAVSNANAGPSTELARGLSEFGSPDHLILSRPSLRSSPDQIHSDSEVMEIPAQAETAVISGSVPDHKENSDSDDMEEVITVEHIPPRSRAADSGSPASGRESVGVASSGFPLRDGALQTTLSDRHLESSMILPVVSPYEPQSVENKHLEAFEPLVDSQTDSEPIMDSDVDRHSRPSSPVTGPYTASARQRKPYTTESWDAAQEMDPEAEEGEFVRFISQVKGRNFDDVRREIDDEITTLNQQKKVAMRDSEDITQQMVSQIMVRKKVSEHRTDRLIIVFYSADHVAPLWDSLHYGTDGSRGAMCNSRIFGFSRWHHHG